MKSSLTKTIVESLNANLPADVREQVERWARCGCGTSDPAEAKATIEELVLERFSIPARLLWSRPAAAPSPPCSAVPALSMTLAPTSPKSTVTPTTKPRLASRPTLAPSNRPSPAIVSGTAVTTNAGEMEQVAKVREQLRGRIDRMVPAYA